MNLLSKSLRLFTAFDIPVKAHISFLFILAFILFAAPMYATAYVVLFASVIVHEFSHALVGRRFGNDCSVIYLHVFGGAAMMQRAKSIKEEWITAIAGPLTSLGLAAIFAALYAIFGLEFFGLAFTLNILIGVFNLAPVFPMDGGRIFKSIMSYFFGEERGTSIAVWTARAIAIPALLWSIYAGKPMFAILAVFIIMFGASEHATLKKRYGWE